MQSTWETRDLPVLDAIVRLYEGTGQPMRFTAVVEASGLLAVDVEKALRALEQDDPPLLTKITRAMGGNVVLIGGPTGAARRAVGAWPTPDGLTDRLAAAFAAAAEAESEPEKRGILRRTADLFGGVGKEVTTEVIAKVITQGM